MGHVFRVNQYDNNSTYRNAIAVDGRMNVVDICRKHLTAIESELMNEQPDEEAIERYSNVIGKTLYNAFHR